MAAKLNLLLILLLLASPVSAKFICGEVASSEETSLAWYEVKAYLVSNENYFSTCKVSPLNNKYCCDIDAIEDELGYEWKISDVFEVKITDASSQKFALPQKITLTAEGYDIAPNLNLEKAISLDSPKQKLTISKTIPKALAYYSKNCSESGQIKNGEKTKDSINLGFGKNEVSLYAICNNEKLEKNYTLFILENISIKNSEEKIRLKSESLEELNLEGKLSSKISDIKLREYVPVEFEIKEASNNAKIKNADSFYNVIEWEVSGESFNFTYSLKSPKKSIGLQSYKSITLLDEIVVQEKELQVYNILPISMGEKQEREKYSPASKTTSKSSPAEPVVLEVDEKLTSALYSNSQKEESSLEFYEFNYSGRYNKSLDYIKSYKINTNLDLKERGPIKFKYETTAEELEKNKYDDIEFFTKEERFIKIIPEKLEDNKMIKYSLETTEPIENIFIFGKKTSPSFFDKILILLNKIGLYKY